MDKSDIIEEVREMLQAIADYEQRLNRFRNKLDNILKKIEGE